MIPDADLRAAAESLCDAVDVPELMGHCATGCEWCARMEQDIDEAKKSLRAALASHPAAAPVAGGVCEHVWGARDKESY